MCGIAGLQITNPGLRPRLGEFLVPMLGMLAGRGPDSTGVAIYGDDAPPGVTKYSLRAPRDGYDWDGLARALHEAGGRAADGQPSGGLSGGSADGTGPPEVRRRGRDAILVTELAPDRVRDLLAGVDAQVGIFGYGAAIEVYKGTGSALDVCARYGVDRMAGYQGVGHTRMATESAVTTEHSHPFAVAPDLALVHNGSFSNYAGIRRDLTDAGVRFDTDNDSEVAARYIARELAAGADLTEALRRMMKVFDGFYTLLVATRDSLAVVRDSFACKPMVIAQTADYVAVGSEYVALADLPGIEKAEVFEPDPEEIYTWTA
jgi:methylamine---glutamate N-methyltransferase subunit A